MTTCADVTDCLLFRHLALFLGGVASDKLVDKFTLPPAALPIGDASLTHVIKLAVHSTT
jgi:hypothetical protein